METKTNTQIAIWLDYSEAHFFVHEDGKSFLQETLPSPYERITREDGEGKDNTRFGSNPNYLSDNEHRKSNTARNELTQYFKTLESKLEGYGEILLFGPTHAKAELHNRMQENKRFANKKITVQNSDKMTDNQMLAYVKDFFQWTEKQ